jgi:hypothetical protein
MRLTVAGSIPAGAVPATMIVSAGNPTLWFASVLRSRLLSEGIDVSGDAVDVDEGGSFDRRSAKVIYTYRSHPTVGHRLPMLKDSINLYGEAALRLNAQATPNTNDAALEGMRRRLEAWGITRDAWQLIDGSGLSRRDVVTPDALVTVLRRMHDGSDLSPWMTALPSRGTRWLAFCADEGYGRGEQPARENGDDVERAVAGRLRAHARRREAGIRDHGEQLRGHRRPGDHRDRSASLCAWPASAGTRARGITQDSMAALA